MARDKKVEIIAYVKDLASKSLNKIIEKIKGLGSTAESVSESVDELNERLDENKKAAGESSSSSKKNTESLKKSAKTTTKHVKATKKLSKVLFTLKSIFISVMLAGYGVTKMLQATVGRAMSAETGIKRLSVAMKSAGRFSQESAKHFADMSVALERITGFKEEETLQALSVLQTFGQMTRKDMDKTIQAAMDMAVVFDEPLQKSAIRLGKAYVGNLRGLQMMGVGIDKATIKAKGFQSVLDQLAKEQGGQAVARMQGFEGTVKNVGVAFGEAGKETGKFITKSKLTKSILAGLTDFFTGTANILRHYRERQDEASEATREHTADLREQEKVLNSINSTVAGNILIQLKKERIELDKLIAAKKQSIKQTEQEFSVSKLVNVSIAERVALEDKREKLTKKIMALEKDAHVLGSKAQREAAKAEAARLKAVRDGKADLEQTKKLLLDRIAADERLTTIEKTAARESVLAILASDARIAEIERAAKERNIQLEKEKADARQRLIDAQTDYLYKAGEERLMAEEKQVTDAFTNMQKMAEVKKKMLADEQSELRKYLNEEINLRISQANMVANINAQALRDKLLGDDLYATERKILVEDTESDILNLINNINKAGSATELQPLIEQFDNMSSTLKGVDSDRIKEALSDAGKALKDAVTVIGKKPITIDDLFDINKLKSQANYYGVQIGESMIRGVESKIKQHQFNVGSLNLKSSFVE